MMLNDVPTLSLPCWIAKAQDAMGQFTAQIVGLPDLRATANSPEEAVQGVRKLVAEAVVSGRLAQISVPLPLSSTSIPEDDALEREFLDILSRARQEDLEQTLREYEREDQGCPTTSSTPTT
jgi:hypothetical protein